MGILPVQLSSMNTTNLFSMSVTAGTVATVATLHHIIPITTIVAILN